MPRRTVPKRKTSIIKKLQTRLVFSVIIVLLIVIGLSVSISLQKTNTTSHAAPAGFVTREGKNLLLNGSPYKFVGFNAYGMTGCSPRVWTQAELDAYFQSLPPASMTRIWAFEKYGANIDLVVARAQANGQKLVMTLGNGLQKCEDVGETGAGRGAAWFQSGYQTTYLPWVKATVAKYKDSPAVGMWEISNEGGYPDNLNVGVMKGYYDDVAGVIKGIDPSHLVSTGAMADTTYGGTAGYQSIHSSSKIDVISFHEYDGDGISPHFAAAQTVSNALNKPIMVGATGVTGCEPQRATLLKAKFDGYLAGGASGVLLWNRDLTNNACGFEAIGPISETATMVKEYVIPGIALTGTTSPTNMITPTGVTPTFVCEGACVTNTISPTIAIDPTDNLTPEPTAEPTTDQEQPTTTEVTPTPTTPGQEPINPPGNNNSLIGFLLALLLILFEFFKHLF